MFLRVSEKEQTRTKNSLVQNFTYEKERQVGQVIKKMFDNEDRLFSRRQKPYENLT